MIRADSIVDRLVGWLYLPPGYLTCIRRITGLVSLANGAIVFNWAHGGPGPYNVFAWRIGLKFIETPMPPQWLNYIVYVVYTLSCLVLIAGKRYKWAPAIILALTIYYGSRDLMCMSPHYVVINACFMTALLFDNGKLSCTRRIMQIVVWSCYFFAAMNKFAYSGWMDGTSLHAMFEDGSAFNPLGKLCFENFKAGQAFHLVNAWAAPVAEIFIAFGLFVPRLRRAAVVLAILLHGFITLFMEVFLWLFTAVMVAGWLAFFEPSQGEANEKGKLEHGRLAPALAILVIVVALLIPNRAWLGWLAGGTSPDLMTPFDRMPWGYHMFVVAQLDSQITAASWYDALDKRYQVLPEGRMTRITSDSELISLSDYLFRHYPDCRRVHVSVTVNLNQKHWIQTKTLDATGPSDIAEPKLTIVNRFTSASQGWAK